MARDGEVTQRQNLCYHRDTTCRPKSDYIIILPTKLIWPHQSLGDSCQTSKMATLLNSLSFVSQISFLPKYRVQYIMIILKSPAVGYNVIDVYRWILPACNST